MKDPLLLLAVLIALGCAHQKENVSPKTPEAPDISGPVVLKLAHEDETALKLVHRAENERDLFAKAFNTGFLPVKTGTIPAIVQELEKGRPVAIKVARETAKRKVSFRLVTGIEKRDEYFILKNKTGLERVKIADFFERWQQAGHKAWSLLRAKDLSRKDDLYRVFPATLSMEKDNPAKAADFYKKLLELEPANANFAAAAANSAYTKDKRRALWLFKKAAELSPNRIDFWYNLAATQRAAGRKSESKQTCQKALAMFPNQKGRAKAKLRQLEASL